MENILKIILFLIINFFILDFTLLAYFLIGQAIGIEYIIGLYGENEKNYLSIILYVVAFMLYVVKLLFLPLHYEYVGKYSKNKQFLKAYQYLQKSIKTRILIIFLTFAITLIFLFIHTKFKIVVIMLLTLLLSSGTSYLTLFLYWKSKNLYNYKYKKKG